MRNAGAKRPAARPGPESPPRPGGRATRWGLAGLLAGSLGIKLAVLSALGDHPLLQPLGELDTAFYVDLGRRVAAHGPLAITEPFFVSPLYVHFLAVIFALDGSIATARLTQVCLGTATVGLVFGTARHWFGDRAAWIAAVLTAFTGLFTFYEILILPAAVDPFLVALTLALVSRAHRDNRSWPVAAAGAAAGLLALNRPNALAYGAFVTVMLVARWWRDRALRTARVSLARTLLFPATLVLVLLPSGVRNYAASGEWVLISSHGGLNFYIGNGPDADGIYSRIPGISPSIAGQAGDSARMAEAALGRPLSAEEVSDYFYGRAFRWIAGHPVAAARLFAWKVALLLNRTDVPLNFSYAYYSRDEPSRLRGLVMGPWLLLPLGIVGLFLPSARRATRGFWIWASFVPVYALSVVAFFVSSRYRMPLLVPLCGSAAATLVWAYERVRASQITALAAPSLVVLLLAIAVNWPLGLDDGRGFEQTRQAVWLVERGQIDDALRYVDRIAPRHSQPGVLHYRVGRALAAANRFDDAVGQFRRSLAIDPGEPATELELGQALLVTGGSQEAIAHLSTALDAGHRVDVAAPWLVRALVAAGEPGQALKVISTLPESVADARVETALDLGSMALEVDAPSPAERWLRLAATGMPDNAEAHEKLGVALLLQERVREAVGPLETARRQAPARASIRLNLAVAYARAGREDEARAEAREARRLDPSEPRAAALLKALGPGR